MSPYRMTIRQQLGPVAVLFALLTGSARADYRVESGDFLAEVERLRSLVFAAHSGRYVPPTQTQADAFRRAAASLLAGDFDDAVARAATLRYHVVEFTDSNTGYILYGLRENLVNGRPSRGWGTYFVNFGFSADKLVEVPHPLFDTNTEEVGALVFLFSGARGFLLAGAHRHANGTGTADVAHLTRSIFSSVHQTWNGAFGERPAWQIHGFTLTGFPAFPGDAQAVLSNGAGDVTTPILWLDAYLEYFGFRGYVYTTLPADDPLSVAVNDGVLGSRLRDLGATTNVQGNYSRNLGGDFVHVELERYIRFNAGRRWAAAWAIAEALRNSP